MIYLASQGGVGWGEVWGSARLLQRNSLMPRKTLLA